MCTQRARRLVDWIWNEENEIKHKVSGTQSIDTDSDAVGDDDNDNDGDDDDDEEDDDNYNDGAHLPAHDAQWVLLIVAHSHGHSIWILVRF